MCDAPLVLYLRGAPSGLLPPLSPALGFARPVLLPCCRPPVWKGAGGLRSRCGRIAATTTGSPTALRTGRDATNAVRAEPTDTLRALFLRGAALPFMLEPSAVEQRAACAVQVEVRRGGSAQCGNLIVGLFEGQCRVSVGRWAFIGSVFFAVVLMALVAQVWYALTGKPVRPAGHLFMSINRLQAILKHVLLRWNGAKRPEKVGSSFVVCAHCTDLKIQS